MTDCSSPVEGSTRGGRVQLQRWRTRPSPCPSQRCTDRLAPAGPLLQPDRARAAHVELLCLQVLRLDQLLVSPRGSLHHRRVRWEHGPVPVRTVAPASHSQVTATPAAYQSVTPRRVCSSHNRSAVTHSAANSPDGIRKLPRGTRAMSAADTSTSPRVARSADTSKRRTNQHSPIQAQRRNPTTTAMICAQGRAGHAP